MGQQTVQSLAYSRPCPQASSGAGDPSDYCTVWGISSEEKERTCDLGA